MNPRLLGYDKACTYFNRPWLEFTGRPLEAELGAGWTDCVHSHDIAQCLETYEQAFDRRQPFRMEYRLRRHDGEYRWILDSGVPIVNTDGTFAGYVGSAVDVTDLRLAREALSGLSGSGTTVRVRVPREYRDEPRAGASSVQTG